MPMSISNNHCQFELDQTNSLQVADIWKYTVNLSVKIKLLPL